jgi:hypothetical protein
MPRFAALDREHARDLRDRALGRRVGDLRLKRHHGGDGTDAHDRAAIVHDLECPTRVQEVAARVGEDCVELLDAGVGHELVQGPAGVVDKDVQAPEALDSSVDGVGSDLLVSDVADNRRDVIAGKLARLGARAPRRSHRPQTR